MQVPGFRSSAAATAAAAFVVILAMGDVGRVLASPGDNLDEFRDCTRACELQRSCPRSGVRRVDPEQQNVFSSVEFFETPALYSRFLLWDCEADCDYQCQQIVTRMRIHNDDEIFQFHGKWPFLRLFGTQELFSVIFSIGNFIPHYQGYNRLMRRSSQLKSRVSTSRKKRVCLNRILANYSYVAIAGMCAWTASTVFHWRDLIVTEKLDYFFAGLTVLAAFHGLFVRMTSLYLHGTLSHWFSASVVFIFAVHLLRLYLDWSYTYNMRFNVFFGILQYGLLLFLAYQNYGVIRRSRARAQGGPKLAVRLVAVPVGLVVFTAMAMSLELFDFFNYSLQIDAHALWHMCTIAPSHYLYDFLLDDFDHVVLEDKAAYNV